MEELYEIMCHNPDEGGLPLGLTGRIVKAREFPKGNYIICEASIPTVVGCFIDEDWIANGSFEVITRATLDEVEVEPSKTIIFDPEQVREASMMVSEMNTILNLTADEVEDRIYGIIKEQVAKSFQARMIATQGFVVRFATLDENTTVVEVTVDPNAGRESKFITATLDSNGNLVAQYPNR